jgi:hypothetical protein
LCPSVMLDEILIDGIPFIAARSQIPTQGSWEDARRTTLIPVVDEE